VSATAARRATVQDLESVTETLWLAFAEDPLWSWAFPNHAQLRSWWRLLVSSALGHGWVWTTKGDAAAAVWIPPGRLELSAEQEVEAEALLRKLLSARADEVLALLERFGASHPQGPPHYYLSLLGTRPDERGRGLGMALLAENLREIDAEGAPAYLESSNPANVPRYEALGFAATGAFATPDGAHEVTTMWRDARGATQ
jgi:GNAT superfamily N-acetyltransferase